MVPVILKGNTFGFEAPVITMTTIITKRYKTAPKILGSPSVLSSVFDARQVTAILKNTEKGDITCKCFFNGNI